MNRPSLTISSGKVTLLSDGKPYLIFGGEVCNSSASSLEYMEEAVWPNVRGLHLNTLVVPVSWELLEPEQGKFDFSLTDGLLQQAEREGVKLVFLWFGLWKNGISTYVPRWVKEDRETYFVMETRCGQAVDSISPLCGAAVERDAAAFSALLGHLKEHDGNGTVLMVQVENEMGLLGDCRDFSPAAQKAYQGDIPPELASLCQRKGSWRQAFGEEAPEIFMTYHYAKAVERIASQGKKAYPLPMYVNAWLEQHPWTPGTYPAGGPIARHMDLWKACAPTIDFLAPDIYLPDFEKVCSDYTAQGNPLFIPEARPSMDSASNVFSAFGRFGALGFSPFAIEKVGKDGTPPPPDAGLLLQLNIMAEAFHHYRAGEFLSQSYRLLRGMAGLLEKYRCSPHMRGFTCCGEPGTLVKFERYDFRIDYLPHDRETPKGGGLIIELGEDEFLVCGLNFQAVPLPKNDDPSVVQVVSLTEGRLEADVWKPGRRLNGDELHIRLESSPSALLCRLKRHPAGNP